MNEKEIFDIIITSDQRLYGLDLTFSEARNTLRGADIPKAIELLQQVADGISKEIDILNERTKE